MSVTVSVGEFQGPIGLLLNLISAQKMDVFGFSISRLVDDYLAEMEKLHLVDLDAASEFYSVAATLLGLKARRLLPNRDELLVDEDELTSADEKELLLLRLIDSAIYRDVSREFFDAISHSLLSPARTVGPDPVMLELASDPLAHIQPLDLLNALGRLLSVESREEVDASHISSSSLSFSDVGRSLLHSIGVNGPIPFAEAVAFATSRYEIVLCFLLVLEGYRLGLLEVTGEDTVMIDGSTLSTASSVERFAAMLEDLD